MNVQRTAEMLWYRGGDLPYEPTQRAFVDRLIARAQQHGIKDDAVIHYYAYYLGQVGSNEDILPSHQFRILDAA